MNPPSAGAQIVASTPNWVDLGDEGGTRPVPAIITFVDPLGSADTFVTSSVSFTIDGLNTGNGLGALFDGVTAAAFDQFGQQIGVTQTVNPATGVAGRASVTLTFSGSIHELDLTRFQGSNPTNGAAPLDDLTFGPLTDVSAAPEPGTLGLLGFASLAAWAGRRRLGAR